MHKTLILNGLEVGEAYTGIKAESDASSLRGVVNGKNAEKDFAVSEWNWPNRDVPNLMIRTKEWKLLISKNNNQKNMDALYDLKNDPYELNNLLFTDRAKHKETAEKLKAKLVDYLAKVKYSYVEEIRQRTF